MNNIPNNKIQRIFGRHVIPCAMFTKLDRDKKIDVYLALNHSECEVYDRDWKKCYHSFKVSDGRVEIDTDGNIKFTYAKVSADKTQKIEFLVQYDRPDLILNIFGNGSDSKKQTDNKAVTIIDLPEVLSFCCGLPKNIAIERFKPLLESQARKRVMFLTSSSEISDAVISAIAIEFRMRFPQIEPEKFAEAFDVLWFEFVAFIVSLYTQCLNISIEPHTGPNSFEYFRRLTASISAIIAKGADVFKVDRREFLISIRKFLDTNEITDIPVCARNILNNVELALGNVRKRWILQLTDLFEFTQLFSVSIAISQSIVGEIIKESKENKEYKETTMLSSMLASWTFSIVDKLTHGPSMTDFQNSLEKVVISTVQMIDSQRYDSDFHCALALWKLSELVKASD